MAWTMFPRLHNLLPAIVVWLSEFWCVYNGKNGQALLQALFEKKKEKLESSL